MPKIRSSPSFKKSYRKLPEVIRAKVKKASTLLAENPKYSSLQTKSIQGFAGIYEARVDQNYRLTYERLSGDKLLLRVVGRHDETLKNS
jgi:addiction module RelE/StbE family toxin